MVFRTKIIFLSALLCVFIVNPYNGEYKKAEISSYASKMLGVWFAVLWAGVNAGPFVEVGPRLFRGVWKNSEGGRKFAAFLGVRYAEPPLGKLRFQDPVPYTYSEDFYSTEDRPDCVQLNGEEVRGEEDCLFLNVYSPLKGKMPVLIWIHGGAYMTGSGKYSTYGPQFLLDHDIVVVTMNYRVGILGFASLDTPDFSGNYGLKDQLLAIKWVVENIHNFGGDPTKITLSGHSAGSTSAMIHMMNNGIPTIKRAIAMSGSPFTPWCVSYKNTVAVHTKVVAKAFNCSIVDCLKSIDAKDLVQKGTKSLGMIRRFLLPFRPVVDGKIVKEDPWTTKPRPFNLMMGVTADETSFLIAALKKRDIPSDFVFDIFFEDLTMLEKISGSRVHEHNRKLREFYRLVSDTDQRLNEVMTDSWFFYPALIQARRHKGELHSYFFNYSTPDLPYLLGFQDLPRIPGVSHGDDIHFLFANEKINLTSEQKVVQKKFTSMIASFIHGKAFTPTDADFYNFNDALLNTDKFQNIDRHLYDRMKIWDSLDLNLQ